MWALGCSFWRQLCVRNTGGPRNPPIYLGAGVQGHEVGPSGRARPQVALEGMLRTGLGVMEGGLGTKGRALIEPALSF